MKKYFATAFFLLFVCCLLHGKLLAQATGDKPGITTCLENYISADADRLDKAFHPSATMKFIDPASGAFRDVPIAEYIQRTRENTNKPQRRSEIVYINIQGTAAQAEIKFETDKYLLYDFMNLLKINGEWKIVSKIFSRIDK